MYSSPVVINEMRFALMVMRPLLDLPPPMPHHLLSSQWSVHGSQGRSSHSILYCGAQQCAKVKKIWPYCAMLPTDSCSQQWAHCAIDSWMSIVCDFVILLVARRVCVPHHVYHCITTTRSETMGLNAKFFGFYSGREAGRVRRWLYTVTTLRRWLVTQRLNSVESLLH